MMEVWVFFVVCILQMGVVSVNGATNQADTSALQVMFSSLNSPQQLTGWSQSGGDPCGQSWKGIVCSGSAVTEIKLSDLQLSGSLGYQLASLTSVTNLDISHNNFGNQMPYQLPPNLQRLNVAGNGFNGAVAYSINELTSLKYLNVSHNGLQGQIGDIFGKLSDVTTMDFSFNALTGDLPQSFSSLSSMTSLYLQSNQFTGSIDVLANLPLDNLNVANNQFNGWIPGQLKRIKNLKTDGNLWSSGPAPPPPPFTPPPAPPGGRNNGHHKPDNKNNPPDSNESGKKSGIGAGAIAGIIISIIVVGAIVAFILFKRRSKTRKSSDVEKVDQDRPFAPLASNEVKEMKSMQAPLEPQTKTFETSASINLRPPPSDRHKSFDEDDFSSKPVVAVKKPSVAPISATVFSVADLQMATSSFNVDNLLGEGSIGRVYRAQFDDGKVLAVKKINSSALPSRSSEDFLEVVSNISRLHHPNVTALVGYCSEHGQNLLVYEFHKNGSLHDFLHLSEDYSKPLTWNSRVKIALGTARALEYLHEVCSPSLVHKNFKSANILLDVELNPHLSDCGLANFVQSADYQDMNQNAGSGYSAPEVAMTGQYTLKSDVYSFGVVMLELLTGRKPFDSSKSRSEQSLVRWATPQLHDIDALANMVDPSLKGQYPPKSLSRFADVVALCVQPEPEFRPPMSEVVQALVRLVQRANMSNRNVGDEQGSTWRSDEPDAQDDMF